MTSTADRSRTITWEDPMIGASVIPTMSGLEYMQALLTGAVPPPPIISLMNMRLTAVDVGTAAFTCEPNESHYNPIGTVHGGFVCTVLDSVAGCAVQTTLPQGQGYTSLEIKVNYLRPLTTQSGVLTAVGTVVKPGSRAAFADAVVTDAAGRVIATASSTLLVFPFPDVAGTSPSQ